MSQTTVTETRRIPTADDARVSGVAKAVRRAARAAARDGRPYFVASGHGGALSIMADEGAMKVCGRYFRVFADRAEVVERTYS